MFHTCVDFPTGLLTFLLCAKSVAVAPAATINKLKALPPHWAVEVKLNVCSA